jgi:CubicO group peptidase (beta-lactamase class C family)
VLSIASLMVVCAVMIVGASRRHSGVNTQIASFADSVDRASAVDAIFAPWNRSDAPGAAVLVVRNGRILLNKGYGLANLESKTPIAFNTAFDFASITKQFAAMAIMMLVECGTLSYDDSLAKFFPDFPPYAQRITVRNLLNHTSGLPVRDGRVSADWPRSIYKNIDYTLVSLIYGEGKIFSTLEDIYRWDQALYGDKLVRPSTLAQAFTPARLKDGTLTDYGFGWGIEDCHGVSCHEHSGGWLGFRTFVRRYPGLRFTVVVASNLAQVDTEALADKVAELYLRDQQSLPGKLK